MPTHRRAQEICYNIFMWKNWLIFIVGIVLIFVPFLGLPLSFARATYVILGLIIALTAFYAARDLHLLLVLLEGLPEDKPKKDHEFLNRSMSEIADIDEGEKSTISEKLISN